MWIVSWPQHWTPMMRQCQFINNYIGQMRADEIWAESHHAPKHPTPSSIFCWIIVQSPRNVNVSFQFEFHSIQSTVVWSGHFLLLLFLFNVSICLVPLIKCCYFRCDVCSHTRRRIQILISTSICRVYRHWTRTISTDRPVDRLIECVGRCADDEADVISFNIVLKGTI